MQVSRNNYEEFFILYVDNELSAAGKKAVEEFLRENPDLREELDMLLDSKITPDTHIVFNHKESLLKHEEGVPSIHAGNYESWFILYADNELNEEDRRAVEHFARQNPAFAGELALFLQARVEPEHEIIFKEKNLLYRHEKPKTVLLTAWVRWTAAAVVLLLAGLLVFYSRTTTGGKPAIAQNQARDDKSAAGAKKIAGQAVTPASQQPLHYSESGSVNDNGSQQLTTSGQPNEQKVEGVTKDRNTVKDVPDGDGQLMAESPDRTKMVLASIAPVHADPGKSIQPGTMDQTSHPLVVQNQDAQAQDVAVGGQQVNPYAKQASITDLLPDNEDGIKIMAFSAKKNTMRGIFRKVTRVFDKTTNVDNDSKPGVLIGNLQVPLKQSK